MKIALLIDASYLDEVTENISRHFLGTDAAETYADLARWLDCVALDAGIRPGENQIEALFIYTQEMQGLKHYQPAHFANEIDGKAFRDNLGEFTLQCLAVEPIVSTEQMMSDCLTALSEQKYDKIVVVAPEKPTVGTGAEDAPLPTTLICNMQPTADIVLGYSVMAALGIEP